MNLIILGPQGSGKGTQAKLLAEEYGLTIVEAGELVRQAAKTDVKISETINTQGKLIPAEQVFNLVTNYIEKKDSDINNLLLDGYPRSLKQYDLLNRWLKEKNRKIDFVIYLTLSEEESVKRLSARRIDEETGEIYNLITKPVPEGVNVYQREDDKPEAIKKRLQEYKEKTRPVIKKYNQEGILIKVDGHSPVDVVFANIKRSIYRNKNAKNKN